MQLEFREIRKSFGSHEVLKGISFTAKGGKAFGLLGRNGAGKTTSMRILMKVFPADSGRVLLDGRPIDRDKVGLGYLPEERGLYPKKKVFEQLMYFAELKAMRRKAAAEAIDGWLERLGMSAYKNRKLDTLSKGNQQKIQLVTALAHDPKIIVLDEPFSGLDPVNALLLKDIVKEEIAKGKVVLFSSHQMNYIEEFCDDIAILNGGEIVLSGNLDQIKKDFRKNKLLLRSPQKEKLASDPLYKTEDLGKDALLLHPAETQTKSEVMADLTRRYEIDEIKVYEPSLNDIFVEYASERI